MLHISGSVSVPLSEIEMTAIRATGPGGQNVNKVASAIHLRFDSAASAVLTDDAKARILQMNDRRISADGVIVIKAQRYRSQDQNREDALRRLRTLLGDALAIPEIRKKTRPSRKSIEKRLDNKSRRGQAKQLRNRPEGDD